MEGRAIDGRLPCCQLAPVGRGGSPEPPVHSGEWPLPRRRAIEVNRPYLESRGIADLG